MGYCPHCGETYRGKCSCGHPVFCQCSRGNLDRVALEEEISEVKQLLVFTVQFLEEKALLIEFLLQLQTSSKRQVSFTDFEKHRTDDIPF